MLCKHPPGSGSGADRTNPRLGPARVRAAVGLSSGGHGMAPQWDGAFAVADLQLLPCSQQGRRCITDIVCCVWLPTLAFTQPSCVCLQS